MMIKYRLVLCAALMTTLCVFLFPAQAQAEICTEDKRLARLTHYINSNKIEQPLIVRASTYLSFNAKLRSKLGDNLRVLDAQCNQVRVENGRLVRPINLDFNVLFSAFYDAAVNREQSTINIILRNFKAAPVSPALMFSLARRSGFSAPMVTGLSKAAGIDKHLVKRSKSKNVCKRDDRKNNAPLYREVSMLDFYLKFGGTLDKDAKAGLIYISEPGLDNWWLVREDIRLTLETDVSGMRGSSCAYLDPTRLKNTFKNLGFEIKELAKTLRDSDAFRKAYITPPAKDTTPKKTSLFD